MPENAIIPEGVIPDKEIVPETAKEKFERERLSRRQALKKFGMTSAMATFALFSVDDLARMVGKSMQQRAADNKVVEQVAKEFQQAGIALGDAALECADCCNHHNNSLAKCATDWCWCVNHTDGTTCNATLHTCNNNADYAYSSPNGCFNTWCGPLGRTCLELTQVPCDMA